MSYQLNTGKKIVTEGRLTQTFHTPVNYFSDRTEHEANDVVTDGSKPISHWVPAKVMYTVKGYGYFPNSGFGNQVWLLHEATGIVSRLCHCLKDPLVSTGDMLDAEEIMAYTGATGYRFPITTIHNHQEEYEADGFDWDYLYRYGRANPRCKRIDPLYSRNQDYTPPAPTPVPNQPKQRPMYQIFQRKRAVTYFDGNNTKMAVIDKSDARAAQGGPLEVYFDVKKRDEDKVRNFFMFHPDGVKQIKYKKTSDGDQYYLLGLTRYDEYVKEYKRLNNKKLPTEDRDNGAKSKKDETRYWKHSHFLRTHPGAMKQIDQ